MTDKFISSQNRTKALYNEFFQYLNDFSNDEKCYIVATIANELMSLGGEKNLFAAELILIHATQQYMQVEDNNSKAVVYYALGQLYEHHLESFVKAYTYYEKYTLNNTANDGNHSVLLRAIILRDNFRYSDELEKHYRFSLGEYDLGHRNDRLYEALASFIIARHENDEEKTEALKKKLKAIIKGDEFFFLDFVLTKEKTPVRLRVPKKVIEYIATL